MSDRRRKQIELAALGLALCFLLAALGYASHTISARAAGEHAMDSPRK